MLVCENVQRAHEAIRVGLVSRIERCEDLEAVLVDYIRDGHRHAAHGDHYDEH